MTTPDLVEAMNKQDPFIDTSGSAFLTQRDLETRWKLSGRTLERWRVANYGPAWIYMGGSVRYRFGDVVAFEERHRKGPRG